MSSFQFAHLSRIIIKGSETRDITPVGEDFIDMSFQVGSSHSNTGIFKILAMVRLDSRPRLLYTSSP